MNQWTKTTLALVRREYWEHRGAIAWVPLALAMGMLLLALAGPTPGKNRASSFTTGRRS